MADHRPPFVVGSEQATLQAALDYVRESIARKASELDDEAVRRAMVPSGTSLLGLVKHLTMAEVFWFQYTFAGEDVAVPASDLDADDTVEGVFAGYRAATGRANEITSGVELERLASREYRRSGDVLSLRWIVVHMIEETARHAGHADILREQIDGQTGR